jgi:imidazolonepropionase-like amidohydrolase
MDTHIHLEGGRRGAVGTARTLINDTETGRRMLRGYLYSGVAGVCDAGNHGPFVFGLRDEQRTGLMTSPRIYATGHLIARTGGYASSGGGFVVDTFEDGIAALDELFLSTPDLVEFIRSRRMVGGSTAELPTVDLEVLTRLITYANGRGLRTTNHAVDAAAVESVYAGINAMAHPVYMTPTDDTLAPLIAAKGIRIATLNAVVYLNIQDRLGSIAPGKIADMVVLSQNPLMDIGNSRAIETVILGGKPVDRAALDLPVNW